MHSLILIARPWPISQHETTFSLVNHTTDGRDGSMTVTVKVGELELSAKLDPSSAQKLRTAMYRREL